MHLVIWNHTLGYMRVLDLFPSYFLVGINVSTIKAIWPPKKEKTFVHLPKQYMMVRVNEGE